MKASNPSVIIIYQGKEVKTAVVCETNEDARKLIGNLFDTKRQFEAHHAELFNPDLHMKATQQEMFVDEDR